MTSFALRRRMASLGPPRRSLVSRAQRGAASICRRIDLDVDGPRAVRGITAIYAMGIAGAAVFFGTPGLAIGPVAITLGLSVWIRMREKNRTKRIEAAFPGSVASMASALRAGLSLRQSLEVAAEDAPEPLRSELFFAVRSCDLGMPVVDALVALSVRCPVPGSALLASAAAVMARSGAHLPPVFDAIVEASRDRIRLEQDLRAATAQGRSTARVVASLPVVFLLIMGAGARAELRILFEEPIGWLLLALGAAFEVAGFAWIRKLVRT